MEQASLDEIDSWLSPAGSKRSLSHALDAEHLAMHHYVLDPGDSFGIGYHRHHDQEEIFYVLEGTATFETEEGEVTVGPQQAIRFAAGEWLLGHNETDEEVVALAIGAPPNTQEIDILRECSDCGEEREVRVELTADRDALVARCESCDAELVRHS